MSAPFFFLAGGSRPHVDPRKWAGNICGMQLQGMPPVPGGASDPALVLSWFYDRYAPNDRATQRREAHARQLGHWLLSWPDSRTYGQSLGQFAQTCAELIVNGFNPAVMLSSKD